MQGGNLDTSSEGLRRTPYSLAIDDLHLECAYRMRSWFAIAFLTVWLFGWAAGSAAFTFHFAAQPSLLGGWLVATAWSGWVVVALVTPEFWRSERLILNADGLCFELKTILRHVQQQIPLCELKRFYLRAYFVRPKPYWVEIRSLEMPVRFAEGYASRADYALLVQELNRHLARIQAAATAAESPERRPTDCRWTMTRDDEGMTLENRGHFSRSWLLSEPQALVICFFFVTLPSLGCWAAWGGLRQEGFSIGGVLLAAVATLLALVFASVGAFGAVASLLEPWRRSSWRFTVGEVVSSRGWGVCRWQRRYLVTGPLRMRVESETTDESPAALDAAASGERPLLGPASLFRLIFQENEGKRLCAVKGLSEGEARWMAQLLSVIRNFTIDSDSRISNHGGPTP